MKIFHHNDNDGRLSAFLVATKFPSLQGIEFVEVNYGKPFPVETIDGEETWIVDFNPLPEEMLKIVEAVGGSGNITWIDHHKTTLEAYKDFPHEIPGVRDVSEAACVLVHKYLYPDEPVPVFVLLVGDRDIWRFKYGDDSRNFHLGSMLHSTAPLGGLWQDLWSAELSPGQVATDGAIVKAYRDRQNADLRKAWAYEVEFEGHKCLAIVSGLKSSELFAEEMDNYDICIAAAHNGDRWVVSLYSKTVDVGEIAKQHGGGGHKGASGFPCERLPFKKLEEANSLRR